MADDDWDLYAVVRSCRITGPPPPAADSRDPFSSFPPPAAGEEARFHGLAAPPAAVPELEELCRPFFSTTQNHHQQQSSSSSLSFSPSAALTTARPRQQPHRPLSQISRSKRRKNQQKRVVCNVPVDGATADMWAWRKYGQKPIKGSPFPRGYYRCSSSKGCPARKQVERSRTDPGTLLITYTAEHNHPVPTHRSSLAGSTRHRFSTAPAADPPTSSPLSTGLSPTTPLTASMEDEEDDEGTLMVEDMEVMGEDELLFMGVDDVVSPTKGGSAAFLDDDDVFFAGGG